MVMDVTNVDFENKDIKILDEDTIVDVHGMVRDRTGQFKKGYGSPNPKGPGTAERAKRQHQINNIALEYAVECIQTMIAIMKNEDVDPKTRFIVASSILERGIGKPADYNGNDTENNKPIFQLNHEARGLLIESCRKVIAEDGVSSNG